MKILQIALAGFTDLRRRLLFRKICYSYHFCARRSATVYYKIIPVHQRAKNRSLFLSPSAQLIRFKDVQFFTNELSKILTNTAKTCS